MKKHVTFELEPEDMERLVGGLAPHDVELDVSDADTVRLDTRAVPQLDGEERLERLSFADEPEVYER